jgi:hypothetical protein
MKNKGHILVAIALIAFVAAGCQKESLISGDENPPEARVASSVYTEGLNAEAVAYFENIKTAIFATGSNLPATRSGDEPNPLVEKLESIEIVKDETSSDVSFFDMDETEQVLFLNDWSLFQAEQMSQKIAANPELLEFVLIENEVVRSVLDEEIIQTRSGKPKIQDNRAFFDKIQQRMAEKGKELEESLAQESVNDAPETRIGISFGSNTIPVSRLKSNLVSYSRKGDFIVSLPKHGQPYIYLDFGNDKFKVGHAGILTKQVTNADQYYSAISVGAHTEDPGVQTEYMQDWSVQCYIMGIQRVKWVWKWRGFKSGFYRTCTPVSNPGALADWAEGYRGRAYVKWYEFLTAKWAAPSRFTCTTLVWWCAKKAYDVNVSAWWATMVTPSGLVTDESTYVRRVVN